MDRNLNAKHLRPLAMRMQTPRTFREMILLEYYMESVSTPSSDEMTYVHCTTLGGCVVGRLVGSHLTFSRFHGIFPCRATGGEEKFETSLETL
jgi:hypothetical protein